MSNRQRSAAVGLYVVGWILLAAIGCIVLVVKTVPPHWALWSLAFIPIAATAIFFAMLAGRCSAYIEHPPVPRFHPPRGGLYIPVGDPRGAPQVALSSGETRVALPTQNDTAPERARLTVNTRRSGAGEAR